MTRTHHTTGFTIIELLIVLTVIAILTAIAIALLRPDPTKQLGNEITQLNQQARYESINTHNLILSTWNPNTNKWQISIANPSNPCLATEPMRTSTTYNNVNTNTNRFNGIIWQPNGLPVTCTGPGQPVAQQQLTLTNGPRTTTITFDSRGRGHLQ